mgnify:FL=1
MKTAKLYVGTNSKKGVRRAFKSTKTPTEASHGHEFAAVLGPFRTKRGAEWCASHPGAWGSIAQMEDAAREAAMQMPARRRMARANPAVACSPNKKRDRYRAAKVMHKGEWVQNGGCWDAKGVPSYVGKGETGKRRVIAKKAVRQKASRTPSRVKGVRARKRS